MVLAACVFCGIVKDSSDLDFFLSKDQMVHFTCVVCKTQRSEVPVRVGFIS